MTPGEKITELRREIVVLNEEIEHANALITELENMVGDADRALVKAWGLLDHDSRVALLDDDYAKETFWNEPEREDKGI